MLFYLLIPAIIVIGYKLYEYFYLTANVNPNGKYVLISGCDTGFGNALAIELDKEEFHVLAGIYDVKNQAALTGRLSSRATVFKLDITNQGDIDAAFELVSAKTTTLHALVNNAGIGYGGLIDWVTVQSMRRMMDVNFFGHVSMTKTFLPLLIAKRDSRVVSICSIGGYLATPGMAAYCSSKFALEAFCDCLRREMATWGLRVSIIEPGSMQTPMTTGLLTSSHETWNNLSTNIKEGWDDQYYKYVVERFVTHGLMDRAENPRKVVNALKHAVMNTVPCIRYRPGFQSPLFFPLSIIPAWITDQIISAATGASIKPAGLHKQMP